jgi:hypothetical protein
MTSGTTEVVGCASVYLAREEMHIAATCRVENASLRIRNCRLRMTEAHVRVHPRQYFRPSRQQLSGQHCVLSIRNLDTRTTMYMQIGCWVTTALPGE